MPALRKRDPSGPVVNLGNFADPSVITVNGVYYAFGTNNDQARIPWGSSTDFDDPNQWSFGGDAMPNVAPWTWQDNPQTWAPAIIQFNDYDGSYGLYYTAYLNNDHNTHCIGLARNQDSVTGPFSDGASYSYICPTGAGGANGNGNWDGNGFSCDRINRGGAIDPASFRDVDGNWYVVYKEDGPSLCGGGVAGGQTVTGDMQCSHTRIMLQSVGNDGYNNVNCDNQPIMLADNAGESDNYNIEAPSIVLSSDGFTYFLFFSAGVYNQQNYRTDYMTSTNGVAGPYGNRQSLLYNNDYYGDLSPGGLQMQLTDAIAVLHNDADPGDYQTRYMHTVRLNWDGDSANTNA